MAPGQDHVRAPERPSLAPVIRRRQMNACRGEQAGAVVRNLCKRGAGALHALPLPTVFTRLIAGVCSYLRVV